MAVDVGARALVGVLERAMRTRIVVKRALVGVWVRVL